MKFMKFYEKQNFFKRIFYEISFIIQIFISKKMEEFLKENPLNPKFHYVEFAADKVSPKIKGLKYYQSGYSALLIRTILQNAGFTPTKNRSKAVIIVGNVLPKDAFPKLTSKQRTNHFQHTDALGCKEGYDRLMKNFFRKIGKTLPFYPETYHLPAEYSDLHKAFSSSSLWIQKPSASARGIGIKVISKMPPANGENIIVQKYISNPMLINSLKFDLRFYVAVTSLDPLMVFVYDNGLVRLATQPYETSTKDLSNLGIHLTNFSINKNLEGFVATNDVSKDGTGNKWSHHPFWPYLAEHGFDPDVIKGRIDDAIVQTILAATRSFRIQKNASVSYELFGFDVMLDSDGNVYILEVNISPAMGTSSELDKVIKTPLNIDLFNMILLPKPGSKLSALDVPPQTPASKYLILHQYEETLSRRGSFRPVFPTKERLNYYEMIPQTENDKILSHYITLDEPQRVELLQKLKPHYDSYISERAKKKVKRQYK